jgi:hypothetical protein
MKLNVLLLTFAVLSLVEITLGQQPFSDTFNDPFDGDPVLWEIADGPNGRGTAVDGSGSIVLAASSGGCCFGVVTTQVPHANVALEMEVEFTEVDDAFFMFRFRDVADGLVDKNDGYWAGLLVATGELGVGYSETLGVDPIAKRGVFLPERGLADGDTYKMRVEAVGRDLEFSVWEADSDPSSGATISWTDPVDRNREGGWVALISNPRGTTNDVITLNSFEFTPLPGCDPDSIGDLNVDGTVGFSDFLILSSNFGHDVDSHLEGDLDCDGTVGFGDFLELSANFETVGAAVATVPEPSGHGVAIGFVLTAFAVFRRDLRHGFRRAHATKPFLGAT